MAEPTQDDVLRQLIFRRRSYTERFEFFVIGATLGILGLSIQLTDFKLATNVELISTAVGWILLVISLIFAFLRAERMSVFYSAEVRDLRLEPMKSTMKTIQAEGIVVDPETMEVWNGSKKKDYCEFFQPLIEEARDVKRSAHSRALGLYGWWKWTLLLGIVSLMLGKLFEPIRVLLN